MDPTLLLAEMRRWASRLVNDTDPDTAGFAAAFQELDTLMTTGGYLPVQWNDAKKEGRT